MKKNLLKILVLLVILLLQQTKILAQYVLIEADKEFNLYNFDKAIDLYEQAYKKKQTLHAAERLAQAYSYRSDYKQAESWYAIVVSMPESSKENVLEYAKALQQNSKYAEAKSVYKKYADLNQSLSPKKLDIWIKSCELASEWMKNPTEIVVANEAKLNSMQSEFGVSIYKDDVVFTSDRKNLESEKNAKNKKFLKFDGAKEPDKVVYGWTGNQYLRLYGKKENQDSVYNFDINANTNFHIGPASFTKSGDEVFFALTKISNKPNYAKGKLATINIEIYSSKKDANGNWEKPIPFKYNNVDKYSVGDPFITADGKSLYFASNIADGKGGTDIYVSHRGDNGEWDAPINLEEINTDGNERTPFLDSENILYFSTDGRVGMGGLDVFKTKYAGNKYAAPKNVGYPTNSAQDDFSYIKTSLTTGYLSSNRDGGLGNDDIYSFSNQKALVYKLRGRALDKKNNQPLANVVVTLARTGGALLKVETDETGEFKFDLLEESEYMLGGEKTDYRSDMAMINTHKLAANSAEIHQDLYLEKIELEKPIRLENIYYDFDKSNIRPDAAIELDKLVKIMKDNPTIWIELGSHTDSRGNDQYNQRLSQDRANSAVQYIISKGIQKNRIDAKGYGESMPLNRCTNGVACTEPEFQFNRRTEFKIVKK